MYVYDEDTIISTIKDFQNSFKSELDTSIISYSTKAFSNPYLLKLLNENDMNDSINAIKEVVKELDLNLN